jgi:hypothetical protein
VKNSLQKTFSGENKYWKMESLSANYRSSDTLIELMSFLAQIFHRTECETCYIQLCYYKPQKIMWKLEQGRLSYSVIGPVVMAP